MRWIWRLWSHGPFEQIRAQEVVYGAIQWLLQGEAVDVFGLERTRSGNDHGAHDIEGLLECLLDRKSTRLNSSHSGESRMPSSA